MGSCLFFGLTFTLGSISFFESRDWVGGFVFALGGLVATSFGLWMAQDRIRNMKSGTLEMSGTVTKETWREGDMTYILVSGTMFEVYKRFRVGEEVVVKVYRRAWRWHLSESGWISQHDIVKIRRGTSSTAVRISVLTNSAN
jgi:hypothetical protein